MIKTIRKTNKHKKAKWLSEEALQIAEKIRNINKTMYDQPEEKLHMHEVSEPLDTNFRTQRAVSPTDEL